MKKINFITDSFTLSDPYSRLADFQRRADYIKKMTEKIIKVNKIKFSDGK